MLLVYYNYANYTKLTQPLGRTVITDSAIQSAEVRFASSLQDIDAQQWNQQAGSSSPFLCHEFLLAMELSGCATAKSGWQAQHVTVVSPQGKLLAVMPLYLKHNSYGEYVFDWSWADAFQTRGYSYYPKLVTAVPYTPSSGQRVLTNQEDLLPELIPLILAAVKTRAQTCGASSWHVLFPTPEQNRLLTRPDMPSRMGCQFHWFNDGYSDFTGFLHALNSRKRKNIRKERTAVVEQGITFEWISGAEICPRDWETFFVFYQNTYLVRGRSAYLNLDFFQQLGRTMADKLLLLFARHHGKAVAGALFFRTREGLFGRYWGSAESFQFLHFETCYYQGIDYSIAHGLRHFDAGAQGEHKIQRGFRPVATWSNHWIAEPVFARAIDDYLQREKQNTLAYMKEAESLLPFRQLSSAETPERQD
ncbi:MAG: GNAT family N-acetyltransferase [Pseudohongiellaceae bacterium]